MHSFGITLLVMSAICAFSVNSLNIPINGGLLSTARIVAKLCLCNHNDQIATAFYNCYNVAPGADLFAKCQMEVNGYLLNTGANISKSCRNLGTFPAYAACLQREFTAAGLDLNSSLDLVNKCEANVVGISG